MTPVGWLGRKTSTQTKENALGKWNCIFKSNPGVLSEPKGPVDIKWSMARQFTATTQNFTPAVLISSARRRILWKRRTYKPTASKEFGLYIPNREDPHQTADVQAEQCMSFTYRKLIFLLQFITVFCAMAGGEWILLQQKSLFSEPILLPSKGATLKGKNLLPQGANSFL